MFYPVGITYMYLLHEEKIKNSKVLQSYNMLLLSQQRDGVRIIKFFKLFKIK